MDRLPPDELGRALEIRGRLTMAASRVAQLASTEAALATIFERRGAFWSVMGPWPFLALLVVAYAGYGAWVTLGSLPASVPDQVRVEIAVAAAYGPLFVLGITVSFPFALLVGRISYARSVRPLLAARPARYAGAPMRCRACGGDLAPTRETFVTCRFCRTQNLLSADLAIDAARRLDQELAAYRSRAAGMMVGTGRAATHMTRTLIACFAVAYLALFGLGAAAKFAISSM
jgi:hypothetical protein